MELRLDEIENLRAEIAALRARTTVVERVAWLGAEVAVGASPRDTLAFISEQRAALAKAYAAGGPMTEGMTEVQRASIAADVDERFRELIAALERARSIR